MRVKSHQLPITMRMAMEFTEDSPPARGAEQRRSAWAPLPPRPTDLLWTGSLHCDGLGTREVTASLVWAAVPIREAPKTAVWGSDGGPEDTEKPGLASS